MAVWGQVVRDAGDLLPRVASVLWRYADYFQLLGSQMPSCHGKAVHWLPPVPLC